MTTRRSILALTAIATLAITASAAEARCIDARTGRPMHPSYCHHRHQHMDPGAAAALGVMSGIIGMAAGRPMYGPNYGYTPNYGYGYYGRRTFNPYSGTWSGGRW